MTNFNRTLAMDYKKLKEEPLKSAVQQDFFNNYKYTQIGNIDFVIAKNIVENGQTSLFDGMENDDLKSLLWAEAKQGTSHDLYESFVQLILTIGKERTFERYLPPKYIGAFDAEKFAFIEYHEIQGIFFQNDFNWNVTPSNHDTKEFRQLYDLCKGLLESTSILFYFGKQAKEFREFVRLNFKTGKEATEKISVTKNNFTFVFQKWSEKVRPTISVDWAKANKAGIISADFFLADLLSSNEESLKDSLYVVLRRTKYELAKKIDEMGLVSTSQVGFNDRQKAYREFWSIYARPPKEEYWDYIIGRRDLLVPQDIRERKGSYFTPQVWVEKSQQYLAEVLGETWQDDYYIWDCCAGTGNLLNGLTNYDRVWASTLDKQDVDVMMDRIANGWAMAENHVFQFDFLNGDFAQCPDELQAILNDPEKRRKLVIYINPPYAEATTARTVSGTGSNKEKVATANKTYEKYKDEIGAASNEIFSQIFVRVYKEIPDCILGEFSKLKILQAQNFSRFRKVFKAKLEKFFLVPANTFDNVKGDFPIGFFVWNTSVKESVENQNYTGDVFDRDGLVVSEESIYVDDDSFESINRWIKKLDVATNNIIGYMENPTPDFQNNNFLCITNNKGTRHNNYFKFSADTLLSGCVYFSVRQCVEKNWLNDRKNFRTPNDGWKADKVFQTDCLIFTLFHGQNRISIGGDAKQGSDVFNVAKSHAGSDVFNVAKSHASSDVFNVAKSHTSSDVGNVASRNHWIPFTREQVGCRKTFKSTFMADYLNGKVKTENPMGNLFDNQQDNVQHELPQMDHELSEIGINENSCEIHGHSCENTGHSCEKIIDSLSPEAQAVYDAGLALWRYYHAQPNAQADASFYDIRLHFQGTNDKGNMNAKSDDETYTALITDLRDKMKLLARRIEPKVYEYGFLK